MKKITRSIDPEVPLPAGAHFVGDWTFDDGRCRRFHGTMRGHALDAFDDVRADIHGDQYGDGTIDRYVSIYANIQADEATTRRFAADLLAAADELAELNEHDRLREAV